MIRESNCFREPAALFLGFEYGSKPEAIRASLNLVKADFGKKTSPLTSITLGESVKLFGMSFMVVNRFCPYPLSWRVNGYQFKILALNIFQFLKHYIVLLIRNFRPMNYIIKVVMPVQFLTQRFETVRYVTVAQGVLLLTIKHVLLIIYAGDVNNSPIMPQWNQYIARRHHHKLDILSPIF